MAPTVAECPHDRVSRPTPFPSSDARRRFGRGRAAGDVEDHGHRYHGWKKREDAPTFSGFGVYPRLHFVAWYQYLMSIGMRKGDPDSGERGFKGKGLRCTPAQSHPKPSGSTMSFASCRQDGNQRQHQHVASAFAAQ